MRTAEVAVASAPTPELAQVANSIANARTKAVKEAKRLEALENYPEHKDYINSVLPALTEYGPTQESRFGVTGGDIIQEEIEAGREM